MGDHTHHCLLSQGFKSRHAHPFVHKVEDSVVFFLPYVDYIVLSGRDLQEMNNVKAQRKERFEVADLGEASCLSSWTWNNARRNNRDYRTVAGSVRKSDT